MSIISKIRQARREARIATKAAQAKARAEVKSSAKTRRHQQNLLAKQEKALLKYEEKGLKRRRKHEKELAKAELARLREGRLSGRKLMRYAGFARTAALLAAPLVYRGLTAWREESEKRRADKAGISAEQLASFSGHGASLKARIAGVRNGLDDASLPSGFKRDVRERLDALVSSVENSEFMTEQQRRRAHSSITKDIDAIVAEIRQRLSK